MVFNLFSLKKKPVIEEVEAKVSMPLDKPAQEAAEAAKAGGDAALAPAPAPAPVAAEVEPVASDSLVAESLPERVAAEAPAVEPEEAGQMGTMKATREDVIAAYKIFLGRLPESMDVVAPRVGLTPAALLVDFLASKEFLDQAPKSQLVLVVAKKILDERKQAAAIEGKAPAEQGQPAA